MTSLMTFQTIPNSAVKMQIHPGQGFRRCLDVPTCAPAEEGTITCCTWHSAGPLLMLIAAYVSRRDATTYEVTSAASV